ncbi:MULTISPECIES: bifunctional 2-polyprenyl-6-hydroxyphenol methylase/3-demethylubiquinol 3-O-methyltransferase UbiG [unclassified Cyanobium]|uniref:class I SAM-dependent methyltransferase n=1 Tax=unclassified Cyanobium TaxID=2627006 RepID=UPI0020CD264D|nr:MULTISPECIES: methyltransferase [unclassified Cyanobium]MCP9778635.1 methyltransferase [Cyanobium sp. Tous-M-B4]MCP9876527.1 methyltransferase [Cyanobium sp. A2C-AMD]
MVSAFYDRFPYPGDPLQDGPPPGYNWRWCVDSAWAAATGALPPRPDQGERPWRILDAGCGTGVSTDYLCHLNPGAAVLAVDISAGALEVARERTRRSGAAKAVRELRIEQRSLLDLAGEGPFDYINSVGVLHHLREPEAGLQALAGLLRPGGLLHLFLYADGGRWEIHRTQRALARLAVGSGEEGLRLGRQLLAELPEGNRLRQHHERRWIVDTAADANFADMYLHPQETSYNLERLLAFVASAGLEFAGFSNPEVWSPARLLSGELLERAQGLSQLEQWSLVEELDPDISHFEFFLSRGAVKTPDWGDDEVLLAARGEINRCLWGWPATRLMGPDLMPLDVSEEGLNLMAAIESAPGVAIGQLPLDWPAAQRIAVARQLLKQRVLLPVL